MPWVQYDKDGAISGVCANQQNSIFSEKLLPEDDPSVLSFLNPPKPQIVLSQDLMAQFTADDAAKIQSAVTTNPQFWLLWSALQAQKDPMEVGNARFQAGWSALVTVLGIDRMTVIAAALGITPA